MSALKEAVVRTKELSNKLARVDARMPWVPHSVRMPQSTSGVSLGWEEDRTVDGFTVCIEWIATQMEDMGRCAHGMQGLRIKSAQPAPFVQ